MADEIAVSEVGICNLALGHLGKPGITSLSEGTKEANLCNTQYEFARRLVLTRSPWTFARRTVPMAQLVENPLSDVWEYAYDVPTGCVKVHRLAARGEPINWNSSPHPQYIEAGVLYTNLPEALLSYVFDNKDVLTWPPFFADAVALKLASRLVPNMTRRRDDVRDLDVMYNEALNLGIEIDAQQETNFYRYGDGYADDRGTGSGYGRRQTDGSSIYNNG